MTPPPHSPQFLPDITNLLLDAICVVNEEGYFLSVSGAYQQIFGYTAEEMIGRQMLELVYEPDRERTLQAVGRLMQGQLQFDFENRYVRKDGSIVHIMWSARWYKDQKIRVAVARDISERRVREQAESVSARTVTMPIVPGKWQLTGAPPTLVTPTAEAIHLSTQDYVVLMALAAGNQQVVSRRDIVQALGKDFLDYDQRRLDSQMRRLRRKVEQACGLQLPISTLRSVGYRCYEEILIRQ